MGTLYVVATPIGNLEDITLRALRILREVDVIACEDTRHTRKLLARHGIQVSLVSYHEHNERERAAALVQRLRAGQDVALVTDAGVPGISDPGYHLVSQALAFDIPVMSVPGPSAITGALSVSGLPADRFLFLGFLPRQSRARKRALEEVAGVRGTLVMFEGPHRIREMVKDLGEVLGPRQVVLVRELTKLHEEVIRGTVHEIAMRLEETPPRGEFTVLVEGVSAGTDREVPGDGDHLERAPEDFVKDLLERGYTRRDAARTLAQAYGMPHRQAYRMVLNTTR